MTREELLKSFKHTLRPLMESQRERINRMIASDPQLNKSYADFQPRDVSQTVRDLERTYFGAYQDASPSERGEMLQTLALESAEDDYKLSPAARKKLKLYS